MLAEDLEMRLLIDLVTVVTVTFWNIGKNDHMMKTEPAAVCIPYITMTAFQYITQLHKFDPKCLFSFHKSNNAQASHHQCPNGE